jgi:hypothetical protein
VTSLVALFLALGEALGLTNTVEFRLEIHSRNFFFIAAVGTFLCSILILHALWSSIGFDENSRRWRKLFPVWSAVVSIFPEVTFDPPATGKYKKISLFRIHRTVVEIRDGILRMRLQSAPLPHEAGVRFVLENKVPPAEAHAALEALRLAVTLRFKANHRQSIASNGAGKARSAARSLDEEVQELLSLSKWWRAAQAAALAMEPTPENSPIETSTRE